MNRLLHRWFVQYNPLYLLSAALVLRGVNLISHGLLERGELLAALGGPALAELYAWALVGGAAVLVRVGLRRPAALLALLAVVFQGDLTLHTEACAWLGWAGALAGLAWLASFALKLVALAWAMQLRPSRSALFVPILGAAGIVVVPRLIAHAGPHEATLVVSSWVFALFAIATSSRRAVASLAPLDAWGRKVLRRALAATWAIWAGLALLHVAFWFSSRSMEPAALAPVALLLATRWIRREAHVALVVGLGLLVALVAVPELLSFAAALATATLFVRAAPARSPAHAAGALVCAHLAVWTSGWHGGPLPQHLLLLDAALALAVALLAWKARVRAALLAPAALGAHLAVQTRLVTAPVTTLEWGAWSTVAGFALLVATVAATVRLHRGKEPLSPS